MHLEAWAMAVAFRSPQRAPRDCASARPQARVLTQTETNSDLDVPGSNNQRRGTYVKNAE